MTHHALAKVSSPGGGHRVHLAIAYRSSASGLAHDCAGAGQRPRKPLILRLSPAVS
jgi:hypothetical protein